MLFQNVLDQGFVHAQDLLIRIRVKPLHVTREILLKVYKSAIHKIKLFYFMPDE